MSGFLFILAKNIVMSKYNRTYHFPFSPGTTSDDRIAKSMSRLVGAEIVITEKLDGENCGMCNDGVYARSHAAFTSSPWSREVRQIHAAKVKGMLGEDEMLFGENMEGIHSIEYSDLASYFYIFGLRNGTKWASWKEVEETAYLLDLPTVPVLFRGTISSEAELKEIVEGLVSGESVLGGKIEGIVARTAESFQDEEFSECVLKWVRKGHVQTGEHWTRNWKKASLKQDIWKI